MDNPLFSVLIANYNNGKYLQEAIDSVLAQAYSNWEIVMVDDGSTDQSPTIYDKYKDDERFHVFYNGENKGCGYTKRRCVELANGAICGFLDPDDVLLPEALEQSVGIMCAHPSSVLCFSRFYYCDENLKAFGESRLLQLHEGESYLDHGDYGPEHFVSFRRDAYMKTDGINPVLKAGVDQELYFRLEEVGNIIILDKITYKYRINKSSISTDSDYALFWNMKIRFDACERRGVTIDKNHATYLYFKKRLEKYERRGAESVRKTKAFRLGKKLLKPLMWLKGEK